MKKQKKLLLLVISIAIIPLVEAITLFGEEISALVLIPSVLIIITLIVFISIIIKDKIKNKPISKTSSALKESPLIEKPTETPILPAQPPKPHIDYLKEVEILERKLPSMSVEQANKQLKVLIKGFFSEWAGINYTFTFEELEKELKKRDKSIICSSSNLSSINYSPGGASKENLIQLFREFKDTIKITTEYTHKIAPEFKKEIEEKKSKIETLLKKSKKSIGKNPDKIRKNYREMIALYRSLPAKERTIIKPLIMNFYNKLKSIK